MRIVHVTQIDGGDSGGGGCKAAWRLHRSLRSIGCDSQMLTLCRTTSDPNVHALFHPLLFAKIMWRSLSILNSRRTRSYPRQPRCGWTGSRIDVGGLSRLRRLRPDIVHLHLFDCVLRYSDIPNLPGPVCWTFHDMGCITGGCHCVPDCKRYLDRCGKCPELGSTDELDASRQGWIEKSNAGKRHDLTAIAPSRWLAREAAASPMCADHRVIRLPNGVPLDTFNPSRRNAARKRLGFQDDRRMYLLAGSSSLNNTLKGFHLLEAIAPALGRQYPNLDLVLFGRGKDEITALPVHRLGFLSSEALMADLFAACDLYVLPTLVDNLPNTLIESIACGTPCVSFNIGGCLDIVRPGQTGWLAAEPTADSLLAAIGKAVRTPDTARQQLRSTCRQTALSDYDPSMLAQKHFRPYREMQSAKP